jgi:outer membrane putative beta-barrel porin/alpha-amylase
MHSKPQTKAAYLSVMVFIGAAELCGAAEPGDLPTYLSDRGDGIATSLLGTYIRKKEFLFYPFYEYTRTKNFQYSPSELGFAGDQDFSGKLVTHEALVFFAYAFNDSLAIEFESALYGSISFTKALNDNTNVPNHIRESGLGDTETNIRWRPLKETVSRPELTFFFKTVFPLQRDKKLLGSQHWEFEPGIVVTKGYSFGTLALRLSAAYDTGESKLDFAEWAVDYVKRLDSKWRVALSLEGQQTDEVSIIGEVQYTLSKNAVLKINNGFGLTRKAPSFAPEIGVLFRF